MYTYPAHRGGGGSGELAGRSSTCVLRLRQGLSASSPKLRYGARCDTQKGRILTQEGQYVHARPPALQSKPGVFLSIAGPGGGANVHVDGSYILVHTLTVHTLTVDWAMLSLNV
jgi:hypothetical protein